MKALLLKQPASRSWFQWSLRSLLVLMLLCAGAFAWYGARLRREARINNAVRLIAASPGWYGDDPYDPISLVRAVNALHALQKEGAIEALRRFAKEYPSMGRQGERHEALLLIIPLLFDRENPEDRFPEIAPVRDTWYPYSGTTDWPFFWELIRVLDDIPFKRHSVGEEFVGSMEDFSYAIDWAEKSGRLRAQPLVPSDNPCEAAERVMIDLGTTGGGTENVSQLTGSIRDQVLRSVVHLLPHRAAEQFDPVANQVHYQWREGYRPLSDDANWNEFKETCEAIGIQWSPVKQAYIATER